MGGGVAGSSRRRFVISRDRLFAAPWTVARQTPLSMGFSRQQYWSGLPFPSPGDLPDPGIEPTSPSLALAGRFFTAEPPRKPCLVAAYYENTLRRVRRLFVSSSAYQ